MENINERLSKDDEGYIRQLIRNGRTIQAIRELKEIANVSLYDAKFWVDNSGELIGRGIQSAPCPYCGQPLRTDLAKQCRHCFRDWHDPDRISSLTKKA